MEVVSMLFYCGSIPNRAPIGLKDQTKQRLREGHSYSSNYGTGEIFRQIQVSKFNNDKVREDCWRAKLSKGTEDYLNRLLKRSLLLTALNSILPIKGVWKAFSLGSLDLILSIWLDEVRLAIDKL
jgi:hypothetical protein